MGERRAASGERVAWILLLAAGCSLVAVFGFFFFRDNFSTHYPFKFVSAAAWRAGAIPWWNLTDGGGQPLAANPNALTFYPDNILYLLLPPHVAFNLHFLIHLIAGWLAMRALTRGQSAGSRMRSPHPPSAPSPRCGGEKASESSFGSYETAKPEPSRKASESSFWSYETADPLAFSPTAVGEKVPKADEGVACSERPPKFGQYCPGGADRWAWFGATLWVLSGAAISSLAFYNLVTAIALIPLAFLAMERRSAPMLALAFGLLALAGEPVTLLATALACAILARGWRHVVIAVPLAVVIALPQFLAYSEIAREVERARGYSARTVLNASLDPRRLLELLAGPFVRIDAPHLFPSLLLGIIVLPALVRRSRYVAVAAAMLFFALGEFNPLIRGAVESLPSLRIVRYPEKFALPLCAALVVLAALFFEQTKRKALWAAITFVPLLGWAVATLPIDWWAPYALPRQAPARVYIAPSLGGQTIDRARYRALVERREALFGATAGLRYVLNRSGDGMHSTLSRIVAERYAATGEPRYYTIAAKLPMAMIVPRAVGVASVNQAVDLLERTPFDVYRAAITPAAFDGLTSAPGARVTSYREFPDRIEIGVDAGGAPALLFVNQSYFTAWDTGGLMAFPVDIDRLGVIVRPERKLVTLRFGHHHIRVVVSWIVSSVLMLALLFALRIEKRDGSAGEVERPSDEDDLR